MSNNHEHDRSGFIRHWLHHIMRPNPPANSATSANTSSDSPSEGHLPPPPYTVASHGDHVEGTSSAPTLPQPLPVAIEVDSAELASQHSQSLSPQANSTVSDDMPPLVPVADTPSASTSRPPTVSRNSRRARVDDEEDEDDQRETNRQRMHSPSLHDHDHDHHFHPDIHAHAEEHRQEREQQQQQQPGPNRPPLFNRISLTFDLFPAFGPLPPQFDTAAGSAQGAARAPGQPQEGATNVDGSVPPVDGAHNVGVGGPHDTPPADFAAFLQRLREGMGPIWLGGMDMDEPDDPGRARRLLAGLEEAPAGLIKRMEAVGKEEGEPVVCAICFDSLLDTPSAETTKDDSAEPQPMDVDPTPASESTPSGSEQSAEDELDKALEHKAVVLPCAHVFHASCLRPWFTRPHRTTCPSCRFDIDPESLTYVPPARVPRPPRTTRAPQAAPVPPADAPEVPSTATVDNQAQAAEPSLPNGANDVPPPQPALATAEAAEPQPQPQNPPRAPQTTVPIGLLIDFNMFFPGLGSTRPRTQSQPDAPANTTSGPVPFGPQPPPPAGNPTNPLSMNGAQFQNFFFGPGPAPAPAANPPASAPPASNSQQPAEATLAQPSGPQPSGAPRNAPQSRVVFHSFSFPLTGPGRDGAPSAATQGGTGQPSNASPPLPSFEEFIRSVGLPILQTPQRPPQPQQEAQQPAQQPQPQPQPAQQPQQQQPPAQDAPATGAAAPGGPQGTPQGPQGFMDAMLGDIASSVFGALFPGAPFVPHTHTHVHHHHPPPPGPIPFAVPLNGQSRGPRPPPPEKRQWTPPPPPGPTLRERIEKKERALGLRCSDISCGLGPSDEDPTPVIDPRTIRQVAIRPLKGKGSESDKVCEHTFHPACLVSAERVAGWSGADQKKEVEDEQEEVEVSCPVCRAVGCISREDWDEGACSLA